jgi:serine/threonine protein kinase
MEEAPPKSAPTLDPEAPTLAQSSHTVRVGGTALEGLLAKERYAERGLLGRGGMGEVRLCHDVHVGRDIAMKVMREARGSEGDSEGRFLREARVQGQLEHPAIVPVYDINLERSGGVYFTMKRVRGQTLEEITTLLRSGNDEAQQRHTRRKLLAAFVSVCLAVDFAHSRGVIHRDLKPANVMLGDFGEVYVLDWGLAKTVDSPIVDQAVRLDLPREIEVQTLAGAVLGTPGYMAPEQLSLAGESVDARSDVYALGAILFELLTWRAVNRGPSIADLLANTLMGVDARATLAAPHADIPPELERICVTAMSLAPDERYPSARALSESVEAYLDGDRDLERRRELARAHVEAGRTHAERAVSDDPRADDERRLALGELGRAVALDPTNTHALRALVELVMAPPAHTPREVEDELLELEREQVRVGGRTGVLAYASFNLYLPLLFWMGVKSFSLVAILVVTSLFAALTSFVVSRLPRANSSLWVLAASALAIASLAAIFGPFLLVPSVAAANTLVFAVSNAPRYRVLILCLGVLPVLLPFALELANILPPSIAFTDTGVLFLPRIAEFPALPTTVLLVLSSLGTVITAALAVTPFRSELDAAQRRIRLTAWNLKHLIPESRLTSVSTPRTLHE